MPYTLTWLPKVLRDAGLKVVEQPGWKTRGHGDMGKIVGVLCHHTAGPKKGNAPSLKICTEGRADLPGPLSQLVLGRDGTFYVVAAGLSYHAGAGKYPGVANGNKNLIGIEAENTGKANDHPWPAIQMTAYAKGVAAILAHVGAPASMAIGHIEWAPGRKSDPSFAIEDDRAARVKAMGRFRATVAGIMREASSPPSARRAPVDGPGDASAGERGPEVLTPPPPLETPIAPVEAPAVPLETPIAPVEAPAVPVEAPIAPVEAPIAPVEPAPVAKAEPDKATVERVQARLRELRYFTAGGVDQDYAGMARGAVVRFKYVNGIEPETPTLDQHTLDILFSPDARPAPVSEARANATAADLAPKNTTVWAMAKDKLLKLVAGGAAMVTAFASYIGEKFRDTWEYLGTFRDMLGAVPIWVWLGIAAAILLAGFEFSRRAQNDQVDKHRRGELL